MKSFCEVQPWIDFNNCGTFSLQLLTEYVKQYHVTRKFNLIGKYEKKLIILKRIWVFAILLSLFKSNIDHFCVAHLHRPSQLQCSLPRSFRSPSLLVSGFSIRVSNHHIHHFFHWNLEIANSFVILFVSGTQMTSFLFIHCCGYLIMANRSSTQKSVDVSLSWRERKLRCVLEICISYVWRDLMHYCSFFRVRQSWTVHFFLEIHSHTSPFETSTSAPMTSRDVIFNKNVSTFFSRKLCFFLQY